MEKEGKEKRHIVRIEVEKFTSIQVATYLRSKKTEILDLWMHLGLVVGSGDNHHDCSLEA